MRKDTFDVKSLIFTITLFFICLLLFYSIAGIFVSGAVYKDSYEEEKVVNLIKKENKDIQTVEKRIFRYITYLAETESGYVFFDEKGTRLGSRKKEEADFNAVNTYVDKKYPSLKDSEIYVGYGIDSPAYFVEEGYEKVVIHFDTLEEVFYMKEGE